MSGDIEDINDKLNSCESMFTWTLPDLYEYQVDTFLTYLLDKHQCLVEENEFKWRSFSVGLVLAFELWDKQRDIVSSLHYADLCCQQLMRLTSRQCADPLFKAIQAVLRQITFATKASLMLKKRHLKHSIKTLEVPEDIFEMNLSKVKFAELCGVKAAIFSVYKQAGVKQALELATFARSMDRGQGEWCYLVAKCLAKLRSEHSAISEHELQEAESACILQRDPVYMVHLAQVYADKSVFLYHNRYTVLVCSSPKDGLDQSKDYAKKAVQNFIEGLELRPNCPVLQAKVAHGLLCILDKTITDTRLAKVLLDKAVDRLPRHSKVHKDIGTFYDKCEADSEKAIKSFTKAHNLGNYSAFLQLICLKWKYSPDKVLIEEINEAMKRYKSDAETAELYVYLGAVYLLQEDNWGRAVECFLNSLELDERALYMERFSGFYWKMKNTNLLTVVTNELRIKIKENSKYQNIFNEFLGKVISTINQNLFISSPDHTLFKKFKGRQKSSQQSHAYIK